MCTQSQLQTILSAIYQKSTEEFGNKLDAVILYGSYARGDYDEESDIDVMVRVKLDKFELKRHRKTMVHISSELGLEHNIYISIHLQDFESFNRYKCCLPFYQNVIREGVSISA